MHLEAHAGLGWAIGVLAPGSDRRLRGICLAAAVLPDIDAAAYLFGPVAYMNYHHTFGHNVFLGALVAAGTALLYRGAPPARRALATALAAICFASHIVTDMKLSAYPVVLFWPASAAEFEFTPNYALVAPINTWLVYASLASVPLLAAWRGVTPLDVIHPRLDAIFLGFFRRRTLACASCGRGCNERCGRCERAVCLRHGRVGWGFTVSCAECARAA